MRLQNELLVQKFVPVDLGVVDLLLQPSLVVHLAIHQNCLTSHREVYIAKLIRMKTVLRGTIGATVINKERTYGQFKLYRSLLRSRKDQNFY